MTTEKTIWSISVWDGKTWLRYKTDDPETLRVDVESYKVNEIPYAVAKHKVIA